MFDIEKFNTAILDVEKRALSIPFGNSKYQIDSIVAEAQTPERAYRSLLLNFEKRFNDLKSGSINRRKQENNVKNLQIQIASLESKDSWFIRFIKKIMRITDDDISLKKEELVLEIEQILTNFEYENKLAQDCIEELKYMQSMIEKMPEYSRSDFENGEKNHFELRATNKPNFQLVENIKSGEIKCLLK